jgi:hypothetical protein
MTDEAHRLYYDPYLENDAGGEPSSSSTNYRPFIVIDQKLAITAETVI